MAFDSLKPQPPRTSANTRYPEPAIAYGIEALARSREAEARCRTVLDVAFGPDEDQKLDLYLPGNEEARDVPVVLYFHGGAWMHGYKEWAGFMAPVLVDLPAIFVSVGYRLAPEHKFPAPLDDAFAALNWVQRNIAGHGGDETRIFAAGWSVGGTLASLITLRRELYPKWGLQDGVIKGCFAACAGFTYRDDVLAPGDSGMTYGDLIYDRPEDHTMASPLDHIRGNRTPFHISHASGDFEHVKRSSAAMIEALGGENCIVEYFVFEGMDHYECNLAHGDPTNHWVEKMRSWITDVNVPTSVLCRYE